MTANHELKNFLQSIRRRLKITDKDHSAITDRDD